MTDYSQVPALVDTLLAEGLPPSADRVRARLGSGSNQTIQAKINDHLRTLGCLPEEDQAEKPLRAVLVDGYSPPIPDPDEVAGHLERLRQETNDRESVAHLQAWLAVAHCLAEPLQRTAQRLHREHARTQAGLSFGRLTDPPHRQAAQALIEGLAPMIQAAETILQLVTFDNPEDTTDGHQPAA